MKSSALAGMEAKPVARLMKTVSNTHNAPPPDLRFMGFFRAGVAPDRLWLDGDSFSAASFFRVAVVFPVSIAFTPALYRIGLSCW
jgi:hypothetical protein